jgi:hypothetical protein
MKSRFLCGKGNFGVPYYKNLFPEFGVPTVEFQEVECGDSRFTTLHVKNASQFVIGLFCP